ncbi:MAG TPA: cobalamin biosynthesis protein, partial [Chloroflexota bacterium]|nr:cobalamin biosynthesis protein [Chloroflexota bacterium]
IAAWRRDAARTASPNAGRPMAVAAGQLGVRLEKPDAYTLNPGAPQPTAHDLAAARRLVGRAMLLGAAVTLVVCGVREHG